MVSFALTVALMATMGFREPFADQWRKSPLLEGPLPGALLQPDNGHRPIVTDLVRLADLRWTSGSGELLVWTGLLAYAGAALLLVRWLWSRAPDGSCLSSLARWCGTAALALGFGFLFAFMPAYASALGVGKAMIGVLSPTMRAARRAWPSSS